MTTPSSRTSRLLEGSAEPTPKAWPKWVMPVVICALALGASGLGVGAYAVAAMPAKTSGPQGPRGATGAQGPQGAKGDVGATGPAGTLAAVSVLSGAPVKSAPNPAVGSVLVAKTSCPAGKILVNGGARVSAPGVEADRNVTLRSSFPQNQTTWQTVAIVTGPLGAGGVMTMTPYVVCGQPALTTTTTTVATTTSTPPTT